MQRRMKGKPLGILFLGDDPGEAQRIHEMLQGQRGFSFVLRWVDSPAKCSEELRKASCEVVLLDLGLGDTQRLATFRKVVQEASHLPIVVLIEAQDERIGLETMRLGAQDCVNKQTLSPDDLARAIRYAIARKRMENELAEREERHRSILERASDGVAIIQDMTIRYANPRLAEIWGVPVSEVIGASIADHLQQDELDRLADRYKRRLAGENVPALYETSLQRRDGSKVLVEVSAGLIAYEGRPADLVLVRDITERKRTEEAVRRSEERYRRIVETAQEGIWATDAENRTTFVNKRMADMLGYTVDEMVGASAFAFIAKENGAKAAEYIERRRQGVSEQFDFRFLRKDGTDLWALLKSSPIQDEDGNYAGVLRMITDITERKRAEEALRESERRYAALFEHSNDGVFVFSPDGVELAVNERGAEMLGYEVHELVGKPLVYDPAEYADALRKQAEVFAGRTIPPYERTFRAKDGSPVLVEVNLTVVRDAERRPLYLQSIVRDIRERKRAEQDLQQSEKRYRDLFDNANDIVYTHDLEGKTTSFNHTAEKVLGYSAEELIGKDVFALVAPEQQELARNRLATQVASGNPTIHQVDLVCKDGHRLPVEISSRLIYEENKPIGVQGIARDITERKDAAVRLQKTLMGAIEAVGLIAEMRDPYTAGHQERVAKLALAIAREMHLPDVSIEALRVAGLLHDIGKTCVPAEILSKPSALSTAEFALVKGHPQAAYDVLKQIDFPWPVADIVLQHHERNDGSGYPQGLSDGDICLGARILAVADVVESMSSHRPYRSALGIDKALQEISEGKGKLYDPGVVEACLRLFSEGRFKFGG